jgi:hypothetical protein
MNCLDCHQADASDVDAIQHEGFRIATIVSPKDCGRCHVVETEQNSSSKLWRDSQEPLWMRYE